MNQDEIPTKRASQAINICSDLARETISRLSDWVTPRIDADNMEIRHAALAASRIISELKQLIEKLEFWLSKPPSQEERKPVFDAILALRDQADQIIAWSDQAARGNTRTKPSST